MSTITHPAIHTCPNCGAGLPLETLACPACHTLVHNIRLDQLAHDARALETRRLLPQARELWAASLTLLPHDSKQAAWVRERMEALDTIQARAQAELNPAPGSTPDLTNPDAASSAPANPATPGSPTIQGTPAKPTPNWVKKLGPFGPIALLLLKLKTVFFALLKLKFLFSFAAFIFLYVGIFGWRYGLGIAASILIHEMGHYIDIRRRGLPAEMPVFLPGLGAYVRWNALGVTRSQIAQISLAGPLAGWIAAALCFIVYTYTHDPLWAALARTGAVLNTLNLVPVWVLDGGTATCALDIVGRAALLITAVALWGYTGEGFFLFVAAGFAWRVFTALRARSDSPQHNDWGAWAYYAAVLIALGVLFHAVPNTLAGHASSFFTP